MPFISSFLIVLARISSIVLNANAENRHFCLPHVLRGKASNISLLSMWVWVFHVWLSYYCGIFVCMRLGYLLSYWQFRIRLQCIVIFTLSSSLSHLSQTLLPTQSPPHLQGFCVFVLCRSSAGSHNCSVFRTATVTSYPKNSLIRLLPCWFSCWFLVSFYCDLIRYRFFFLNLQRQALWLIDLSILKKMPPDNEKNAFSAAVWWGML